MTTYIWASDINAHISVDMKTEFAKEIPTTGDYVQDYALIAKRLNIVMCPMWTTTSAAALEAGTSNRLVLNK